MILRKITIVRSRKPKEKDINKELQWISKSLGLFSERDKEKSCFRVFVQLLEESHNHNPLSSDEIASRSNLSRATVIHHINRLMDSGLVIQRNNRYILRVDNLQNLVDEIEKDMVNFFKDIKKIAKDIDERL